MPETNDGDALVGALLSSCCEQVLETMFFSPVLGNVEPEETFGQARIHAELLFHGRPSGSFEVDVTPEACQSLAAGFLGVEEAEVSPKQLDQVLAEFANMACGSALSSLARVEYFHLDPSRVEPVENFAPAVEGVRRAFQLDGGTLGVCLRVDFDSEN
jgi:hypothetical protein